MGFEIRWWVLVGSVRNFWQGRVFTGGRKFAVGLGCVRLFVVVASCGNLRSLGFQFRAPEANWVEVLDMVGFRGTFSRFRFC